MCSVCHIYVTLFCAATGVNILIIINNAFKITGCKCAKWENAQSLDKTGPGQRGLGNPVHNERERRKIKRWIDPTRL